MDFFIFFQSNSNCNSAPLFPTQLNWNWNASSVEFWMCMNVWTHIVILTLAEQGLLYRHEQQTLHIPAFLCPVHVMQHTWNTLVLFCQWACIRSICGPTKLSRCTTQLQASSDSFSSVCPSPSLAVTTAGTGAQSINRSPKAFDSGAFLPPSPLNHTICLHTVAATNENVYVRMNKTWNSLFLVAEALTTSRFLMGARVWSPSLNR